jgi:hypothetical protein
LVKKIEADAKTSVDMHFKLVIFLSFITSSFGIFVQNELKNVTKRENVSPAQWTEPDGDGLWSTLLEEWTLNNK